MMWVTFFVNIVFPSYKFLDFQATGSSRGFDYGRSPDSEKAGCMHNYNTCMISIHTCTLLSAI